MAKIKVFRGPEVFIGTLQEQVNKWAQKENVHIISVSSSVGKGAMGLCSVNFVTLSVAYEPSGARSVAIAPVDRVASQVQQLKKCPFCAEDIQAEAKKCRYCNEWLPEPVSDPDASALQDEDIIEEDTTPPEEIIFVAQGLNNISLLAQREIIEALQNHKYAFAVSLLTARRPHLGHVGVCEKLIGIGQAVGVDVNKSQIESDIQSSNAGCAGMSLLLTAVFAVPLSVIGWVFYQMMFK